MRTLTLTALAIWLASPPLLGAQGRAGQFEFGAFGAYTTYDDAFGLDQSFGGGTRLGYFFTNNLGLEVDVLFGSQLTVPGSSSSFEPVIGGVSVLVNLPLTGFGTLYAVGGYSRLDFGTVAPYEFTDGGLHGGAGVRVSLNERFALRLEGRAVYTPETNGSFGSQSAQHLVATAGFSLFHSKKSSSTVAPTATASEGDTDGDGVVNTRDACPGTPSGATVDARGCQLDQDADGVADGPDRCPGTPTGATVDAAGCPADRDGDVVWDGLDQCPDTPLGAIVDRRGCPSDADGDRVVDGIDYCADTPPGAQVNALGCSADEDADRIPDGVDQCPATPLGAIVDAKGCPMDGDHDRVFDGQDQCANTPPGAGVDSHGCETEVVQVVQPVGDTDQDGVTNPADRCPNTPAGSTVDATGCVILFRDEPGAKPAPLVLHGVTFTTGRSVITRESYPLLDAVASSLVAHADVRIEIAGHTDDRGTDAINLRLSQARAAAVRAYLARKGVPPTRLVARGYGETQPTAPNATDDGRAANRRVELRRIN